MAATGAVQANGLTNGHHSDDDQEESLLKSARFSYIPSNVELPVQDTDVGSIELDLDELATDPTELISVLEDEKSARNWWITVAMAYAKQNQIDAAIEIVSKALEVYAKGAINDKLYLYSTLCWLYLIKARNAPRVASEGSAPDTMVKDNYLKLTTSTLNDASRLNPSFPPLLLARGALCLLRAALTQNQAEKNDILRQASKAFDDSLRASNGKNMLAMMGRARTKYSSGRYQEALKDYQHILRYAPDIIDPDPRIGIGCCFWQLGHPDEARGAWQRALALRPQSKSASALLGVYFLHASSKHPTTSPKFQELYKKAMTGFTQTAFKLDPQYPMTCATFSNFFLNQKAYDKADTLAKRAVELTDVNTIASDGWFTRARHEHYVKDFAKAADFYQKSDDARGGDEKGHLPAKFGAAQLRVQQDDFDGAKFRLEKILQKSKSIEAMALLGALLSADIFEGRLETPQEVAQTTKRALFLLEAVRSSWKDPARHASPDHTVLLNLARLYEVEQPDRSLECLRSIEKAEMDDFATDDPPEDEAERAQWIASIREQLNPQLLSNIGCFEFNNEKYEDALNTFQAALKACTRISNEDSESDTDALVTTISYNLARTYEAVNMPDEASEVYEGLLSRHAEYTDAKIRQVLILLKQSPHDKGPKAMGKLYEAESQDLEVRSLYGYFVRKAKKKVADLREDAEQRHFKHTLQNHDKYDRFALTGMGNLHLTHAREMKRDTEEEKKRRNDHYDHAVQFFDKALQLDPRNAYAAQGIAIAMIEARRDFRGGLQILLNVKDTIKDSSVHNNLGHVYCELKQFVRAIESYEAALRKDRQSDPQILACLGRAWLLRGKAEGKVEMMKTSLEYSKQALAVAPEQIHFRFNVAFVQTQLAQLVIGLADNLRTSEELVEAANDLDAANEAFSAIAKSPNPPFPRNDIEQRANMGRNTMKKQLDRALAKQREYETQNADKLRAAREKRAQDQAAAEEARRQREEAAREEQRRIGEQRAQLAERDRQLAEQRREEDRKRAEEEEDVLDDEGNVVVSKKKGGSRKKAPASSKRKKKDDDFLDDDDDVVNDASAPPSRSVSPAAAAAAAADKPRKKRKLERKATKSSSSKYKSADVIDSDDDLPPAPPVEDDEADLDMADAAPAATNGDGGEGESSTKKRLGRKSKAVVDDEDEDEDDEDGDGVQAPAPVFDDDEEDE